MDNYFLLKMLHILSATVLTGTGAGIAFFMFMTWRSGNTEAIRVTTRHVVLADWIFTTPAVVIQLVTGLLLANRLGIAMLSPWMLAVTGSFIFIGCCWLPVVWIQYKLRALAGAEQFEREQFDRYMRLWTALGVPAFTALLVVYWLMVFKPLAMTQ
ncbi:MAG: hypothetical protein CSH37_14865 [Thalassolituus sp.]|nr:MAG: hypothetical protein CSH37_14865 [Thalassolituus sp.]